MKIIVYFFITWILLLSNCGYDYAQNEVVNKQALKTIKDFYTAWSTVTFIAKDSANWNSIQKRYCIQKLIKEEKEWFRDGGDLYTNDWGIDHESLKYLTILKDSIKKDTYIVSYIVTAFPVSPAKPVKKNVTLHVGIVREDENYKISSVK